MEGDKEGRSKVQKHFGRLVGPCTVPAWLSFCSLHVTLAVYMRGLFSRGGRVVETFIGVSQGKQCKHNTNIPQAYCATIWVKWWRPTSMAVFTNSSFVPEMSAAPLLSFPGSLNISMLFVFSDCLSSLSPLCNLSAAFLINQRPSGFRLAFISLLPPPRDNYSQSINI